MSMETDKLLYVSIAPYFVVPYHLTVLSCLVLYRRFVYARGHAIRSSFIYNILISLKNESSYSAIPGIGFSGHGI